LYFVYPGEIQAAMNMTTIIASSLYVFLLSMFKLQAQAAAADWSKLAFLLAANRTSSRR